jgi:hypothetical protein
MATPLDPRGEDVRVGELTLRTRGYEGIAELTRAPSAAPAAAGTLRAETPADHELAAVFERTQLVVLHELTLDRLRRVDRGDTEVLRSATGSPGVELDVPEVTEGWEQMLLATDADGIVTWHFARRSPAAEEALRGTGTRTFSVRAVPVPPPALGEEPLRGLLGGVGHVLIRVLAFPLKDAIGRVGRHFAHEWEERKRPYRLRPFTPADYTAADPPPLDPADWERLGEGRALLFLHGTFSRAHTGFGRLPREAMDELHRRYGGRIFAFDHFTLSEDPAQNVDRLLAELPDQARLRLDVVSHSRGGLVARVLARRQLARTDAAPRIQLDRVVFAGTPNAGTALADFDQLGELIDRWSTLLSLFPDPGVTDVLESIVTVAKTIAVDALEGLPGLTAMRPGGNWLQDLNKPGGDGGIHFRALASDYEASLRALLAWLSDHAADAVFKGAGNDLVAPADGVWAANGAAGFPIAEPHVFGHADHVVHTRYFANATSAAKLLDWLPGDA